MDCHQMKSVISLVDSHVRSAHATSQSSGPLLVLRCRKCLYSSLTVIALELACEANVSVWFQSKEQPRKDV